MPMSARRPQRGSDDSPRPVIALTRRNFLVGVVGIAALGLAACGGANTATPLPATAAPSAIASTAAATAPVQAASAAPVAAASAAAASSAPSAPGSAAASAASSAAASAAASPTRPAATPATPIAGVPLGPGTFPATVTHMYGTTTVRQAPRRVVSVGYNDQDTLLALDVVPVGILRWFATQPRAVGPWAEPKLGAAQPTIIPPAELDFEAILKLQPDLIVGIYRDMKPEEYQRLSQIAPTIAPPVGSTPFGVPWRDEARLIAGGLGQTPAMERIIADVEGKFAAAKRANPQFAGKNVVVSLPAADGQYYAYSRRDGRVNFMEEIGLTLSPAIDALEKTAFYTTLSRERVNLLEADVLIFLVTTDATLQALKADTLLQGLNVAKQNRIIYITDVNIVQAYAMNSVLSLPYAIEQVVPQIAQIIK